mmetsp:Transcript_30532/g.45176  ORF Transcript_30532/g.45176 Transcript_30532/m.45176 type:complete len:520 (-) Transcript_30532:68-1627(-)
MKFTATPVATMLLLFLSNSVLVTAKYKRNLRSGSVDERVLVADAILSAIKSPEKQIDPQLLFQAHFLGIPSEFLHHLAREAQKKVENGVSIEQIESDMRRLRQQEEQIQEDATGKKDVGAEEEDSYSKAQKSAQAILSGFRSEDGKMDRGLVKDAIEEGATKETLDESLNTVMKFKAQKKRQDKTSHISRALLSAFRHPDGEIEATLLSNAIEAGATKEEVQNALARMKNSAGDTLPPPVVCGVSVIIGNYEKTMKEPDPPLLDVFANEGRKTNLFMYTDQEHLLNNKNSAWTALPIDDSIWQKDCLRHPDAINNPCKNLHPFNFAKFYKTQPYRLEAIREAGCNVVVWFDGSIKLHDPSFFQNMTSRAHRGQNFVVYTHSYLKGRLEDEAQQSLPYYTNKIFHGHEQPPQDTMAQYNYYVQQGFKEHWFNDVDNGVRYPEKYGMYVTCMVMFDLRQSITKEFLDCWWEENLYRTYQDQVSFPYCAWKLGVYPHALPDAETQGGSYEENPYFTKMKHMN